MEPVLLIALILAFGIRPEVGAGPLPRVETLAGVVEVLGLILLVAGLALIVSLTLRWQAGRGSRDPYTLRRKLARSGKVFSLLTLVVYTYILFGLNWTAVVEQGMGLRDAILADEILILAPFLITRLSIWWALYPAERALRPLSARGNTGREGAGGYLLRRARQSLGLILPAVLLYALGNDLANRIWPGLLSSTYAPVVGLVLMGATVLTIAPAFIRLSWPMRRLPPGPLRERLERLSRRLNFRYSDILIWETQGAFVNAGVTGAFPWYRYVLLTDTLIESLPDREIEAVFGHEIGHIAHRHLVYFGFFFVGSLGIMALVGQGVDLLLPDAMFAGLTAATDTNLLSLAVKSVVLLGSLGLYFLLIFGYLSRRFERQADIYGCRAVSCGRAGCPPHLDVNAESYQADPSATAVVCPAGIRTFANALASVARLNGMEPGGRSWRHGSIAQRIAFLESLEGRPESEVRFQQGLGTLRIVVAAGLLAAFAIAVATGALNQL